MHLQTFFRIVLLIIPRALLLLVFVLKKVFSFVMKYASNKKAKAEDMNGYAFQVIAVLCTCAVLVHMCQLRCPHGRTL